MNTMNKLTREFSSCAAIFAASPAIEHLLSPRMTTVQYASALRQIYYQARENPQIQAFATARFRGRQRASVKRFFQHATSEIGHDQLALNDLQALGENTTDMPIFNAAPTTIALTSFAYYQASHLNPVGYLGYLFFLEFLPTTSGARFAEALAGVGVPREAMSFLMEHATVDVHHNRLMESYVRELVCTEEDLSAVTYAMRVTGDLYARMLEQALFGDHPASHWGIACHETYENARVTATDEPKLEGVTS